MIGVRDLSVRFGPITALDGVSIDIRPGTIHALAGENGSGKSTLLKVLGGAQAPSAGSIVLDGAPAVFADPARAAQSGVGLIFQELSLFPHLSGYSNIFIGREPVRMGLMQFRRLQEDAERLVRELGFPRPDLARPVAELSVAEQQVVEILKCLARKPRIILFDEPTASLTQREIRPVLAIMKRLRDEGYTVVFVSHYLEEVFEVADRITVLRDGQVTLDAGMAEVDRERILSAMLGRALTEFYPARRAGPRAQASIRLDNAGCDGIEPVSLEIRAGEILGVAGAVGSGSAAFGEMLGGLRPLQTGRMEVLAQAFAPRNAAEALRAGVAYVPEDRRTEALLLDLSVATNMSLPLVAAPRSPLVSRGGFLRRQQERAAVNHEIGHMNVRPANARLPARALSGGNQQKVVLGRWFLHDRPCLVLNNPTKGVDVGSKAEIYRHIADLADSGHAIILVSNYNPELLGTADRIIAFREGRVVACYGRGEASEDHLLEMTMGAADQAAAEGQLP
ncbi:sugar ABC transporter ATP-binding protein [Acidisoma sp. C75]